MKIAQKLVIVTVVLLAMVMARGATFTNFVGFGSAEALMDRAVKLHGLIAVSITQFDDSNIERDIKSLSVATNLPTKAAIDDFVVQRVDAAFSIARTNSSFKPDRPFYVRAYAVAPGIKIAPYRVLSFRDEFTLTKNDGSYSSPDFSKISMGLYHVTHYEIDDLAWARLELRELYEDGTSEILFELDSRYPPPDISLSGIMVSDDYIRIETALVLLGTNSPTRLKVSICTTNRTSFSFRVFDPMGDEIVGGTPIVLTNSFEYKDMRLDITGGDPGRILKLQSASSLLGPWVDEGEEMMIGLDGYPPLSFLKELGTTGDGFRFYRVVTVPKVPMASFTLKNQRL